jgi:hypothetical protein
VGSGSVFESEWGVQYSGHSNLLRNNKAYCFRASSTETVYTYKMQASFSLSMHHFHAAVCVVAQKHTTGTEAICLFVSQGIGMV